MKKLFLFLSVFYCFFVFSQSDVEFKPSKHKVSIGMSSASNRVSFESTVSNSEIQGSRGNNQSIRFNYRFQAYSKWYLEAGVSLGLQREVRNALFESTSIVSNVFRFAYSKYDIIGAYSFYNSNDWFIRGLVGAGVYRFAPVGLGMTYQTNNTFYLVDIYVPPKFTPGILIGFELAKINKRKDELGARIMYNYGWKSFYDGDYALFENGVFSDGGSVSSLLSGLSLGVYYTFTRDRRRQRIVEMKNSGSLSFSDAKRKIREGRRIINPDAQYLHVDFGLASGSNVFKPRNELFRNPVSPAFAFRVGYERGWKNNLFFEIDYHQFLFLEGAEVQVAPQSTASWSYEAFNAHFLNVGIQYKIQHPKTHFQFFNIHGGFGLGAHFLGKGIVNSRLGEFNTELATYSYTVDSEVLGNLMPVIYGGLSKDIRFTERVLLSLSYRYQLGVNNVYNANYVLNSSDQNEPIIIDGKINGTAFLLQAGLKYKLK